MQAPYKCESIENQNFDIIFTSTPYNIFANTILDPFFTNKYLSKIAKKIMYIVYGPHIFHQYLHNDTNLPKIINTIFVDSESTKNIFQKYYNFDRKEIVVSGYQTYKFIRDTMIKAVDHHSKETILWMPRWLLSFKGRDLYESGSTFLNYHYFFYNYALNNPHINFIIRPHFLLFSTAINNHHMSQRDLDTIFIRFSSLKNVTISNHENTPLVHDILAADIVIGDGTSALAEAVVADKAIIYLSNGWNNEFNSNQLSKLLKNYVYLAYDPYDIEHFLNKIRLNKYSPIVEESMNAKNKKSNKFIYKSKRIICSTFNMMCDYINNRNDFKKALDPVENPAKFIAEYILYN